MNQDNFNGKNEENQGIIAMTAQKRIAEAVKFFDFLYDRVPTPTFIYLAKFKDKREFPAFSATDAKQRQAMAVKAVELSELGNDIWHSVNPVSVKPSGGKRGDESAVAYQVAIVTDIDIRSDAHKSENLAADFDEAKSFLPFAPTILINSGYGIQAYYVFETPIKISDDNREECKRRNELFLDVIRARANGKTIDAVGDLPRILRTPGTFNYKLGKDNAPLCHIVDFSDVRFTPAEIDEKLAALPIPATTSKPVDVDKSARNHREVIDDSDFDIYRARRMLDFINPASLSYEDWFAVGAALKNVGCSCSDWEDWSKADDRFKDGECEYKWDTFDRDGYGIGTLYNFAAPNGYDAKEIYREYADLHPDFARKRADRADVFDKFNTDRLQSMRKQKQTDAEPIGISDSNSPKAKRQERADRMNDLMTTREVADFLDVTKSTVEKWRQRKLFGCYFFPADEKHGNTFYYRRERVEQLKAVYQFGILQNMYKLARRNPEPEPLTVFSEIADKPPTSEELSFRHREFFTLDEVADYFGVQRKTVEKWHERGILSEDMLGHNGDLYFAIDNVLEFTPPKERKTKPDRADVYNESRADARPVEDIIADIRDYQCEWKVNKKGERLYILPTSRNIRTIFNNDPNLKNLIGYDEFNGAIALTKRPAWSHYKRFTPEWTDTDDAQLRMYLRENYAEFQADKLITQAVISISQERIFNAVKNYFARLPKWDGTPRAETLFIKYLRVEDTPYAREITLNWLTAAVARIYEPGCRYQTALVLQGAQGIGKSYIIELLGGKWYLELTDSVDDSHASDAIKKGWIVELKEMAAMRKAEINAVKAFIERASEKRREPYAKIATETPRHCVFAITVNDSEFLRDQTGNRRYMILKCNSEKLGYVDGLTVEEIKQVWAEVLVKYNEMFKNGFDEKKLSLSRETALKAEEVATRYLQDDGMAGEVKAFLDKKILPQYIWQLLTREERRKFFADGRLVLPDGLADLNKRRRARGGKEDDVQHDVNLISSFLDGVAGKNFVRRNEIKRGDDTITEYIAYGSEYRQHICAAEIFNECFGSDKRKSMYRINEIFINLDGWTLGARLRNTDSVYFDQRKPYYRDADNIPDKTRNEEQEDRDDYYNEPIDPTDTPF